jgi:hypothetical protein
MNTNGPELRKNAETQKVPENPDMVENAGGAFFASLCILCASAFVFLIWVRSGSFVVAFSA